jgi:hypothetical protein
LSLSSLVMVTPYRVAACAENAAHQSRDHLSRQSLATGRRSPSQVELARLPYRSSRGIRPRQAIGHSLGVQSAKRALDQRPPTPFVAVPQDHCVSIAMDLDPIPNEEGDPPSYNSSLIECAENHCFGGQPPCMRLAPCEQTSTMVRSCCHAMHFPGNDYAGLMYGGNNLK